MEIVSKWSLMILKHMKTVKMTKFEKRNAVFNASTPEGKRVLIFKDMLSQVRAKMYLPKQGIFAKGIGRIWRKSIGKQVCDVSEKAKCTVCQLGGLIISTIRFVNDVSIGRDSIYGFQTGIGEKEDKTNFYFNENQLKLMEIAFEKGKGAYSILDDLGEEDALKAVAFGKKYKSNHNRMIAICENAIKNGGTFIP